MFKSRTERRKKKLTKIKYKKAEELSGSQLSIAFRRFRKNKAGLIGLFLTLVIFALAIFADGFAIAGIRIIPPLTPYNPLEPMALDYHYTPWYQPPGFHEGSTFVTTFNQILEGNFETNAFTWTFEPGWQRINYSDSGISAGTGAWGAQCTTSDVRLYQDLPDEYYFSRLLFMAYLDGPEETSISVIFTFDDNSEEKFDFQLTGADTWITFTETDLGLVKPRRIIFEKSESSSNIIIDQVDLLGGEYFRNLHLMGTNRDSQDVFSKLIYGTRVSLIVSLGAIIISLMIGLPLGLVAGYFRGKVDEIIMRVTDIFLTLPFYFVMILVIVLIMQTQWLDNLIIALGLSAEVILLSVTVGLGLFGWMGLTRLIRSTILQVREMDYVEAARALGASNRRIMIIHILPNILAPLIVATTFNLAVNIVAEAGLAYLGYTNDQLASWGRELSNGFGVVTEAWWPVVFPAILIISAVMAFNLLGDGLRDAFDPRLR